MESVKEQKAKLANMIINNLDSCSAYKAESGAMQGLRKELSRMSKVNLERLSVIISTIPMVDPVAIAATQTEMTPFKETANALIHAWYDSHDFKPIKKAILAHKKELKAIEDKLKQQVWNSL